MFYKAIQGIHKLISYYKFHILKFTEGMLKMSFNLEYIASLVEKEYGMVGHVKELGGFSDNNYLITIQNHPQQHYLFKVSSPQEHISLLNLQNKIFQHLLSQPPIISFPVILPTTSNKEMIEMEKEGSMYYGRLLTFLIGEQMWSIDGEQLSEGLYAQIGQAIGKLLISLKGMQIDNIEQIKKISTKHYLNTCDLIEYYQLHHLTLHLNIQPLVQQVVQEFKQIQHLLPLLPQQIIHNDITPSNLILTAQTHQLSAIIDFSSAIYTYRICELAAICARISYKSMDLLKRNHMALIGHYNQVLQITKEQKLVLWVLIKARVAFLCIQSCRYSANKSKEDVYFSQMINQQFQTINNVLKAYKNHQFLQMLSSITKNH